jgi:hypothetical protein
VRDVARPSIASVVSSVIGALEPAAPSVMNTASNTPWTLKSFAVILMVPVAMETESPPIGGSLVQDEASYQSPSPPAQRRCSRDVVRMDPPSPKGLA